MGASQNGKKSNTFKYSTMQRDRCERDKHQVLGQFIYDALSKDHLKKSCTGIYVSCTARCSVTVVKGTNTRSWGNLSMTLFGNTIF